MSHTKQSSGVLSYAASAGSSVASYLSPLIPSSIKSSPTSSSSSDLPASSRDIDRFYHVKVRPLLDAVDQLRGLLANEPIRLPSIVVVGDQSSGKSSVLEALSGVSLPRGQSITTRCPLILRLVNLTDGEDSKTAKDKSALTNGSRNHTSQQNPKAEKQQQGESDGAIPVAAAVESSGPKPYAYISLTPLPSDKDKRITNLDDIGGRISALTQQLAGSHVSISDRPIYLSVYRQHSPDLTLVDLPGLTRNPVGDQPKDIYQQIKRMIERYIESDEAVILNVMPASVDFPTCECVMMSKAVDPVGERSIGVVTKADLAEKGIRRKLEKGVEELGLQLGVVAVRCRSQEENDRGVTWEVSREMEKMFFKGHQELSALADSSGGSLALGISALAQLLTTIQEQKIRASLPGIRGNIRETLATQRQLLASLPPTLTSYSECRMRVDHLLSSYVTHVSALARGDHSIAKGDTKLHLSPRLSELYSLYMHTLASNCSNYLSLDYARTVQEEIKENSGVTLPNFLSHQVFEGLMRRELRKALTPSQQLVEGVRGLMGVVLGQVMRETMVGYGGLSVRLMGMVNGFLDERSRVVLERVDELLGEEDELFTQNSYYMDTVNKIKAVLYDKLYGGSQADREARERQQQVREREQQRGSDSRASQGRGGWLSNALSSAVPVAAGVVGGGSSSNGATSSIYTFSVNDLTITVDLNTLTLPLSASTFSTPLTGAASASSALSNLLPTNSILDMQINVYAYSVLTHKRLADHLPLLLRYHLVKGVVGGLGMRLGRELGELGEKGLVDLMREEKDVSVRRERLVTSVSRLEKALHVLESL